MHSRCLVMTAKKFCSHQTEIIQTEEALIFLLPIGLNKRGIKIYISTLLKMMCWSCRFDMNQNLSDEPISLFRFTARTQCRTLDTLTSSCNCYLQQFGCR